MRKPAREPDPPLSSNPRGKDERVAVPVIEEELSIARVTEKTGNSVRVSVSAHEETERVIVADVIDELHVERVPVNRFVTERSPPREEGDVTVIPVFEMVAVVERRLWLKEEIRIVRKRREVEREEEVVLMKETASVERKSSPPADAQPDEGAPARDAEDG